MARRSLTVRTVRRRGAVGPPSPSQRALKLSVIMPAYNEAGRIAQAIRAAHEALSGGAAELVVVDDGSADDTFGEATRVAAALRGQPDGASVAIKVVRYEANRGKGHALRHGFGCATGDVVVFLDADLDLHPRQIWQLWQTMRRTGADVVVGSKRHDQARLRYPPHRRLVSWVYSTMVRVLFGLPVWDTQTGLKLFRHEVLARVLPRMRISSFAYDLELLVGAYRFGYTIVETPVELSFNGQKHGGLLWLLRASLRVWLDSMRVYYWASFWKWLNPSLAVKVWLGLFVVGIFLASFSLARFLTTLPVPEPVSGAVKVMALQFVDRAVRDALFFVVGMFLIVGAGIQLNKRVLAAFASPDRGDLASIGRRNHDVAVVPDDLAADGVQPANGGPPTSI